MDNMTVTRTKTLSHLSFKEKKPAHYFNSASIGLEVDVPPRKPKKAFDWDEAVNIVQHKFGKLIDKPSQTISVFHNTTAGVQRILLRLSQLFGSTQPTLLLSDLEYPGIVSAVDEMWPGRVVMAQVANLIWMRRADEITGKLKKAILIARPSVVYLSHIARSTGYRIDEKIVDFIRSEIPHTVIVIDGAQACGNIHVDTELLDKTDFYVTSGHKWLCGTPTLGLVYSQEKWSTNDPAQSYSMTRVPTGTGSKSVIQSLEKTLCDFNGEYTGKPARDRMRMVEDHNADLARAFCRKVKVRKLGAPLNDLKSPKWKWNGIATIVFDSPDILVELKRKLPDFTSFSDEKWRDSLGGTLHSNRYFLNPDESDKAMIFSNADFKQSYVPNIEGYPARFCFHYYHNTTHVDRLVAMLSEAKSKVRAQRRRNRKRSLKPLVPKCLESAGVNFE